MGLLPSAPQNGPALRWPCSVRPHHVNAAREFETEVPSVVVRTLGLPCGASASLRPGWPARTFAAPFYRCTMAPTRLGSTLLSQREDRAERARHDFCRWMSLRAQLRITRTSRNQRRAAVLGRPLWLGRKSPFCRSGHRSFSWPGAGSTDARHSPSRLPASRTSPQPRSLRAPLVTSVSSSPAGSSGARKGARPRSGRLQDAQNERAAMRRASAKKTDPDHPRCFPSNRRSQASGVYCQFACTTWQFEQCLLHHRREREGHPHTTTMARRACEGG